VRRGFSLLACAALALACKSAPLADIAPGEAPPLESEEAGFWMTMERVESDISTSGNRFRDPALDAYLKDVICRIAPDYCSATRVYVMRQPDFNASMAPNGMMVVWTGLLIRVQNEAQLAAVLGHELGHYQRRHTLTIFRRARATTSGLMAITLLTGGIVPGAADVAMLIGISTLMQHSRQQESEADAIGIERIARAGYDPREVAEMWRGIARENEADDQHSMGFFSSHPAPETRLREMAAQGQRLLTSHNERGTRTKQFDDAVARFRLMLLNDEIAMRKHERSLVVIERLQEAELLTAAEAAFFRGELFRVRGEEGDDARAIAEYREAAAARDSLPVTQRNLGLVLQRVGDRAGAREAFQRYVELAPDANDRAMVETYIQELAP